MNTCHKSEIGKFDKVEQRGFSLIGFLSRCRSDSQWRTKSESGIGNFDFAELLNDMTSPNDADEHNSELLP